MGMDIYFQSFDQDDDPCCREINLRNRELYHVFNEYFHDVRGETPDNGEEVRIYKQEWKNPALKNKVSRALYEDYISCGFFNETQTLQEIEAFFAELEKPQFSFVTYRFTC